MTKLSGKKEKLNQTLGQLIMSRFRQAELANQEHHRRCLRARDLLQGKIDTVEDQDLDMQALNVAMNITGPITRNVHAQVEEILDPILEQPFVLKSTAVAQLPQPMQDELMGAIESNIQQIIQLTGGDEGAFQGLLENMSQTALQFYNEEAQQAAENLYPVVLQDLHDANFKKEFSNWLLHYCSYPLAILKGPVLEYAHKKRWNGYAMVYEKELVRKVYNVSPFNIFPAPNAQDLQSCEYVMERMRFNASELLDMAGTVGFDAEAIYYVLQEKTSYKLPYMVTGDTKMPDADEAPTVDSILEMGQYDVLVYYGQIRGSDLRDFGVQVSDEYRLYESEVWLLGEVIIKAVINPDELGRRPFYHASFYHNPGELWGAGVPETIEDVQIQITQAARALMRNMELASGPLGEVDTKRVTDDADPTELYPGKITPVKNLGGNDFNSPVYRFYNVPSLANELWGIIDKGNAMAYELIGIPRLAFGQAQGAATIGRTSGGVSMMLNQAGKSIKQPLLRAETQVIEPIIQRFVDYQLQYNPDPGVKGDVNVYASGVRGLQEKEQNQQNLTWVLQSLAPFASGFSIPPEYMMRVLQQLLSTMGINTKGLPNLALQDAMSRDTNIAASLLGEMQGGVPAGAVGGGQPPSSGSDATQYLDGRSQGAINTINNMNNIAGV